MKSIKKGLAVFLSIVLMTPNAMTVFAEESGQSSTVQEKVDSEDSGTASQDTVTGDTESTSSDGTSADSGDNLEEDETGGNVESTPADGIDAASEDDLEDDENVGDTNSDLPNESDDGSEETSGEQEDDGSTETVSQNTVGVDAESISQNAVDEILKDTQPQENAEEEVSFNTGSHVYTVVDQKSFDNGLGDAAFEENGSYTINIPEENPFFPYEVQFTYEDQVSNEWFMTPEDSIRIGEHDFYVSAGFDNAAVTQMSLNVAGDTVVVYPEEKEFSDGDGIAAISLLPLEEKYLTVDLTGYTPAELTMVSVDSIFTGEKALTDTDKVIWEYAYDDGEYTVSSSGDKIDLSYATNYGGTNWQMIVGANDQLESSNVRYNIRVKVTDSNQWLLPSVYAQDDAQNRTDVLSHFSYSDSVYDKSDREEYIYASGSKTENPSQLYINLSINPDIFSTTHFDSYRIYEGKYETPEEAAAGTDITDRICAADMSQPDVGYPCEPYSYHWITMLTYDAGGNVTGCLPVELYVGSDQNCISLGSLHIKSGTSREYVSNTYRTSGDSDGLLTAEYTLYSEYPANGQYYLEMDYYKEGSDSPDSVTAAYVGQYSSIADAVSQGAENIKVALFDYNYETSGYAADYSGGVYFTVFVGEDGSAEQEIYHYLVKTETGTESNLNRDTMVNFTELMNGKGEIVPAYFVDEKRDSYSDYNYLSVLVDEDVDLTNLAFVFTTAKGVNLYAQGSSTPEESGVSLHDFSSGMMQFTASSEDGNNSKNYWIQIVKASAGAGRLYINSLADENSGTETRNGVIYSKREVMLDGYHDNVHDILVANMGKTAIDQLSVEFVSDTVEMDEYWTLHGTNALAGFNGVEKNTSDGELQNLALLRLKAKAETKNGADVSGTLTFKSGSTTLMVLTLTGTVGNPCIITEEIPEAVKYVPYGTMIQNNNKYSWNNVSYMLLNGTLPEGMELRSNGELYGVPKAEGDFTFTVRMNNSYRYFGSSQQTYTLEVLENTDSNVDNATDQGYELTQRIQDIDTFSEDSQTVVSEGEYGEFVDIYLDGEKLEKDADYTSEEGSTRITIRNQTLAKSEGKHTLGIEFRTSADDTLMRAAQNYDVSIGGSASGGSGSGGSASGGSGSSDSGDGNNSGSTGGNNENSTSAASNGDRIDTADHDSSAEVVSQRNSVTNANSKETVVAQDGTEITAVVYTVEDGDTLWSIAQKFYGSGEYWSKIFSDNADIISNPDVIYVGWQLKLYLAENDSPAAALGGGTYHTVGTGDSLWKISQEYYGVGRYWDEIYLANKEIIADPDHIYKGQIILIPER